MLSSLTPLGQIGSVAAIFLTLTGCAHQNVLYEPNIVTPKHGEAARLLKTWDRDGDKKITVLDTHEANGATPSFDLQVEGKNPRPISVKGTYELSNLLQELTLAGPKGTIRSDRIFENPVERISRSIRDRYWDNLTRRVDRDHLAEALIDPKLKDQQSQYVYVPSSDRLAYEQFGAAAEAAPNLKLHVVRLPPNITPDYMNSLRGKHGLLTLKLSKTGDGTVRGVPFVVPGGRFNEMYGWDSYFESLGLLADNRLDLARAMADNQVYQIEHYGKILNANRTYYLNRSQPPFLTSFVRAVYERSPRKPEDKAWLERGMRAAIKEYESVWMNKERLTPMGLSRYFGEGREIPPEVERGHFDYVLKPAAKRHKISIESLTKGFNEGKIRDEALAEFFMHDRAVRESGHDTTYRWRVGSQDRAADFVTVDLNSLLYKYELDIAKWWRDDMVDPEQAAVWRQRADRRRNLMVRYLWDPKRKIFFDYNYKGKNRSQYVSATAFFPFWAEDPTDPSTAFLSDEDTQASINALLKQLEAKGGLLSTGLSSIQSVKNRETQRQWDYPHGWAPHQIIAWTALTNRGRHADRDRLIYKWLYMITRNAADFNGTIPEKFDVVNGTHLVFAEYGNVGTTFAYITQEGFGWMNASYQLGLGSLPEELRDRLRSLSPPPEP